MQHAYLKLAHAGFHVEQTIRVVRHEVGHWLLAEYHGFKAGEIKVMMPAKGGQYGHSEIELESDLTSTEQIKSYLRRRISVLYAGSLAESLGEDGKINRLYANNELEKGGATNDFKGIRELLRVLRGATLGAPGDKDKTTKQLATLGDEIWLQTVEVVEVNHELIQGLTRSILERAERPDKAFGYRGPTFRKIPNLAEWLATLHETRGKGAA